MLDPGAMDMFQDEMRSSRRNGHPSSPGDRQIRDGVSRIQVSSDPPETSESGEEVTVTRSRRSPRGSRDTGVFKGAMSQSYSGMRGTRNVMVEQEDDDEEEMEEERANGRHGGSGKSAGRHERRERERVRSRGDSETSGGYEYEPMPEDDRKSHHRRREIIPDPTPEPRHVDDDDDFHFQGQRMRIGDKKKGKVEGGKRFLKKVQHELEEERNKWRPEVEKMVQGSQNLQTLPMNSMTGGTNSFVDESSGHPIYKAFFDVSEFPPDTISVVVDKLSDKVVVQASKASGVGNMTKSFTQKVQLPRYADESRLTSRLSKKGILKVEVPLVYYFNDKTDKPKQAKSFINEVKTNPRTGKQYLEILVNTDPDVRAKDLHVQVEDDKLEILADTLSKSGKPRQKLIKQYTLPKLADPDNIKSKLGRDGRLAVTVPLRRVDTSVRDSPTPPTGNFRTLRHEVSKRPSYNGAPPPEYYRFQQQTGYRTLDHPSSAAIRAYDGPSGYSTMPAGQHYGSEPILYDPKPRGRQPRVRRAPAAAVEEVRITKSTRKVRH